MENLKNIITREEYQKRHPSGEVKKDFYVEIPQGWWRGTLKGLRPVERCLLVSLRVAGQQSRSINTLARELGITWRTAKKGLESLRQKGFLPYAKKHR